jgi:hypothetical protein
MAKERIVIELNGQEDIAMRDELKRRCGSELVTMGNVIKNLIRKHLDGSANGKKWEWKVEPYIIKEHRT